jgi:hypothetical protein
MANQWLRLWHDMPTDPKWRTIAKASGQRIGDVMAVYVHLLVCASNAAERGRTQSFNAEDVASALDMETDQVELIHSAMQGRVLEGDMVAGWEKRQVAREDGSAERAKAWREAQKSKAERTPNAPERNQAPDKDTDTDTDKEEKKTGAVALLLSKGIPEDLARDFVALRKAKKAPLTETALKTIEREAVKAGYTLQRTLETCCARGWQGFEAIWVQPKPGSAEARTSTVPSKPGRDPALVKLDEDAKKAAPIPLEQLERMAAIRAGKVAH